MSYLHHNCDIWADSITESSAPFILTSIPMEPGSTCALRAQVIACATDGTSAFWEVAGLVKRVGANAVQSVDGFVKSFSPRRDSAAAQWDTDFYVEGDCFHIRVIGDSGKKVYWTWRLEAHGMKHSQTHL